MNELEVKSQEKTINDEQKDRPWIEPLEEFRNIVESSFGAEIEDKDQLLSSIEGLFHYMDKDQTEYKDQQINRLVQVINIFGKKIKTPKDMNEDFQNLLKNNTELELKIREYEKQLDVIKENQKKSINETEKLASMKKRIEEMVEKFDKIKEINQNILIKHNKEIKGQGMSATEDTDAKSSIKDTEKLIDIKENTLEELEELQADLYKKITEIKEGLEEAKKEPAQIEGQQNIEKNEELEEQGSVIVKSKVELRGEQEYDDIYVRESPTAWDLNEEIRNLKYSKKKLEEDLRLEKAAKEVLSIYKKDLETENFQLKQENIKMQKDLLAKEPDNLENVPKKEEKDDNRHSLESSKELDSLTKEKEISRIKGDKFVDVLKKVSNLDDIRTQAPQEGQANQIFEEIREYISQIKCQNEFYKIKNGANPYSQYQSLFKILDSNIEDLEKALKQVKEHFNNLIIENQSLNESVNNNKKILEQKPSIIFSKPSEEDFNFNIEATRNRRSSSMYSNYEEKIKELKPFEFTRETIQTLCECFQGYLQQTEQFQETLRQDNGGNQTTEDGEHQFDNPMNSIIKNQELIRFLKYIEDFGINQTFYFLRKSLSLMEENKALKTEIKGLKSGEISQDEIIELDNKGELSVIEYSMTQASPDLQLESLTPFDSPIHRAIPDFNRESRRSSTRKYSGKKDSTVQEDILHIQTIEKAINDYCTEVFRLTSEIDQLKEGNLKIQNENIELQKKLKEIEDKNAESKKNSAEASKEVEEVKLKLQITIDELTQKVKALEAELMVAKKEIEVIQTEKEKLGIKCMSLNGDHDDLKRINLELEENKNAAQLVIQNLRNENETLKAKQITLEIAQEELQRAKLLLQNTNDQLNKTAQLLAEKSAIAQESILQLQLISEMLQKERANTSLNKTGELELKEPSKSRKTSNSIHEKNQDLGTHIVPDTLSENSKLQDLAVKITPELFEKVVSELKITQNEHEISLIRSQLKSEIQGVEYFLTKDQISKLPKTSYQILNWMVDDALFLRNLTILCTKTVKREIRTDIKKILGEISDLNEITKAYYKRPNENGAHKCTPVAHLQEILDKCTEKQKILGSIQQRIFEHLKENILMQSYII